MYDKSLIAHLLPSEMIIKNYIHGDPDCNYEKYLLEFVNASDFFRAKSDGDIYQSPESEENGQCDCISTSYQLDFKLIASKTALQARSILASKINIKNLILLKNDSSFNLSAEYTGLEKGDYLFLQRFLDSTKANLFFAKGIIMVEGDAESLLIPTLADVIGINLEKHGISVVNVGGTGFFRYSRIFLRKDGSAIDVPISIITDCDIEPDKQDGEIDQRETETTAAIVAIQRKYNVGCINAFVAPKWTFEYSVAFSCLRDMLYESILQAKKIENSDQYALAAAKIEEIEKNLAEEKMKWSTQEPCVTAYQIYHDTMLNKGEPVVKTKATSKAIVAQCLASNLRWAITEIASAGEGGTPLPKERMFDLDLYQTHTDEAKRVALAEEIEKDPYLSYLVLAIKHAAGIEG